MKDCFVDMSSVSKHKSLGGASQELAKLISSESRLNGELLQFSVLGMLQV